MARRACHGTGRVQIVPRVPTSRARRPTLISGFLAVSASACWFHALCDRTGSVHMCVSCASVASVFSSAVFAICCARRPLVSTTRRATGRTRASACSRQRARARACYRKRIPNTVSPRRCAPLVVAFLRLGCSCRCRICFVWCPVLRPHSCSPTRVLEKKVSPGAPCACRFDRRSCVVVDAVEHTTSVDAAAHGARARALCMCVRNHFGRRARTAAAHAFVVFVCRRVGGHGRLAARPRGLEQRRFDSR